VFDLNKVKEYRLQCNFTQIELARRVGVARQTINLIENDKYNPSLSLCITLAKELRTDLNSLFWEEEISEESDT
jgi:putative transcriptional regulator